MPKFQILRMETLGTPPVMKGAVPWTFDDPQDAAEMAKAWSKAAGEKACVKPVLDEAWRRREEDRYKSGDYRYLPWELKGENWWRSDAAYAIRKDHYAHASLEKPGFIAYTKSVEDGAKDKQSLLRPGAYLNRYFAQVLADYGVNEKKLVDEFMAMYGPIDVKFAETADDIVQVYNHGPQTCIHKDKFWPKNIHPASIYAAGDLQVAYIGNKDGKVSARTIVWPAKKIHSRVYGDIARLTQGLQRLGYKWGAPIGARLKRIQLGEVHMDRGELPQGCFLVPYLDKKNQQGGGHLSVKDMGDHLIICPEGEPGTHHAGGPDGYSGHYTPKEGEKPKLFCARCEEECEPGDTYLICTNPDGGDMENWCRPCADEYAFHCAYSGNFFPQDDIEHVEVDGEFWAKYYAEMYAKTCEMTGELTRHTYRVQYPDGTSKVLGQHYIDNHTAGVFKSGLNGRYYFNDQRKHIYIDVWGERVVAGVPEVTRRAFQCDGCDHYYLIEMRHQTYGDDRLFCPNCVAKIMAGQKNIVSPSRKRFEEERKQLPLIAAE